MEAGRYASGGFKFSGYGGQGRCSRKETRGADQSARTERHGPQGSPSRRRRPTPPRRKRCPASRSVRRERPRNEPVRNEPRSQRAPFATSPVATPEAASGRRPDQLPSPPPWRIRLLGLRAGLHRRRDFGLRSEHPKAAGDRRDPGLQFLVHKIPAKYVVGSAPTLGVGLFLNAGIRPVPTRQFLFAGPVRA